MFSFSLHLRDFICHSLSFGTDCCITCYIFLFLSLLYFEVLLSLLFFYFCLMFVYFSEANLSFFCSPLSVYLLNFSVNEVFQNAKMSLFLPETTCRWTTRWLGQLESDDDVSSSAVRADNLYFEWFFFLRVVCFSVVCSWNVRRSLF